MATTKIEIEKVRNGYILKEYSKGYSVDKVEVEVYENFLEMVNWIALKFE